MRLDALLSRYGYCSRREAPGWIKRHSITFKGKPCSSPTDKVQAEGILLDGEPVEFPDGLYAALYKPESIAACITLHAPSKIFATCSSLKLPAKLAGCTLA